MVGCDGTGKSTLTRDLVKALKLERPTEWHYMGLVSGETGNKIKQWPIIGPRLERRLAKKTEVAQDMRNQSPPPWAALIMYGFSLWRASHLKKVRRIAKSGVLVITDRYPQSEVTGFYYDGPGLGIGRSKHWLIKRLALREQRLYEQMATWRPELVIRLDIDLDTAFARKPDHRPIELRDKIEIMTRLQFNGARIVDLDARRPYLEVLDAALAAVKTVTHPQPPAERSPD